MSTIFSQEFIFGIKKQLQEEITAYEKQLQDLIIEQKKTHNIEKLALSIMRYDQLESEIADRTLLFSLFSGSLTQLRSPYVKSQLFEYIEAAETVSVEIVDVLVSAVLTELRDSIQLGDDDSVDLIQAEYKEYILPGKIIAERFDEIDALIAEMNRFCKTLDLSYSEESARSVLVYAFRKSIDADTRMPPTVAALQNHPFAYLLPEDRAGLLDHVNEHLAVLRYNEAKKQQIAMEQAIAQREKKE